MVENILRQSNHMPTCICKCSCRGCRDINVSMSLGILCFSIFKWQYMCIHISSSRISINNISCAHVSICASLSHVTWSWYQINVLPGLRMFDSNVVRYRRIVDLNFNILLLITQMHYARFSLTFFFYVIITMVVVVNHVIML